MRSTRHTRTAAIVVTACLWSGCGGASRGIEATPTSPPTSSSSDAAAMARARADSARYPYIAADIRFMSGMIGHHAQAIEMSKLAPANGAGASVRTLAERIINAQQDEIRIMQQWLRDRGQPVPQIHMMDMPMHHDDHAMMPGMLTPEQLKQLSAARGKEFDRLFLTYMIQHHRGAISMVRELFGTPGAAQDLTVFKVANEVNVDQTTEVARMQKMLAALISDPGTR
jgi:uncharacterized protein (DUF305 family)